MSSTRARCRRCRCTAYIPMISNECACSHQEQDHGTPPGLPPRPCGTGFFTAAASEPTPLSVCIRCGSPYFEHEPLDREARTPTDNASLSSALPSSSLDGASSRLQRYLQPPTSPLISSQMTTLSSVSAGPSVNVLSSLPMWRPPGVPQAGSVNERRMASAAAVRGVSLSPFAALPTVARRLPSAMRQRVMSRSIMPSKRSRQRGSHELKYLVIIHTEPSHGTILTDSGGLFTTLRAPAQVKLDNFIRQLKDLGLVFNIECSAEDDDLAAPVIHARLCSHFRDFNLAFATTSPESLPSTATLSTASHSFVPVGAFLEASSSSLATTSSAAADSESDQGRDLPWTFLFTSKGQRTSAVGAKLLPSMKPATEITHRDLHRNAAKLATPSHPWQEYKPVYIIPTRDVIVGSLNGDGMHFCLAMRAWNGYHTVAIDELHEHIDCTVNCTRTGLILNETSVNSRLIESNVIRSTASSPESQMGTLLEILQAAASAESSSASSPSNPVPTTSSSNCTTIHLPSSSSVASPPLSPISPLFSDQPLLHETPDNDVEVRNGALWDWQQYIKTQIQTAESLLSRSAIQINIMANSATNAAQGFLDLCMSWSDSPSGFSNDSDTQHVVLPPDTRLMNCNPTTINFGVVVMSIAQAVGTGPLRTFWTALISLITQRSEHWQLSREDGFYVPVLTSIPPSHDDLRSFRAYGLIIRTGLIWGMQLLPISPAVILLLIAGYDVATSDTLLSAVAPLTAQRLRTWPPSEQLQLGTDPYNMILEIDSNIQLSQLRNLTPSVQAALGQKLRSLMVFNNPIIYDNQHPIYRALGLAFSETVYGDMQFLDSFHTRDGHTALNIITGMFSNRVLTSPEQVINRLHPVPLPRHFNTLAGFNAALDYASLASQWVQHLKRYLRGHGIPTSSDGSSLFPADDKDSSNDPLLRPRLFLQTISGSEFLPANPNQEIRIHFVPGSSAPGANVAGLHVHTCFYTLDVLLNFSTAAMITNSVCDVDDSTDFDRWIHSIIADSLHVYNDT